MVQIIPKFGINGSAKMALYWLARSRLPCHKLTQFESAFGRTGRVGADASRERFRLDA